VRSELRGRLSEQGIGHVLLVVVVLFLGLVAVVALRDSVKDVITNPERSLSSDDAMQVARTVGPAVVDLDVTVGGAGSRAAKGFVLTPAGEVVTSSHALAGAREITARVGGTRREYSATVSGYDVGDDVAVLALSGASGLATIEPAHSSLPSKGDAVAVVGGAAGPKGVVTGIQPQAAAGSDLVAIDVTTRRSDSGAPVADENAKVVAMIGVARNHVTFAMPIRDVLVVAHRVEAGQSTDGVHVGARAVLGVGVRPTLPDDGAGAYVVKVARDGPAAKAGLVPDTIIVSLDSTTIATPGVLHSTLDRYRPGNTVRVGWVGGDGVYRAQDVELASGPPP
jgi:S1-C subfamily serine protease